MIENLKKEKLVKKLKISNKGITLIALVITIIVLLILAGVSIATLTGENGILTQANDAKTKTERGEVIERAKLDVLALKAQKENKGKIREEQFDSVLKKYDKDGEVKTNEQNEKYILTERGEKITAKDIYNGEVIEKEVFNPETLTIGEAINTSKYGYRVSNYTADNQVWRLFYQDNNYTYLISSAIIGSYKLSDYCDFYRNGSDVSVIGQKLNPMLLEKGTIFVDTYEKINVKATAWLTDPTQWEKYKNNDAVFAIGSPTIELFAASYNSTGHTNTIILNTSGTYGYTENTEAKWLDVDHNRIYNYYHGDWWIASPMNNTHSSQEWGVMMGYESGQDGQFWIRDVESNPIGVRPIVCIPTTVFNSNYKLEAN